MLDRVILDTNIFVAAGFNPNSNSAAIIQMIKERKIGFVWNEATRAESKKIVDQIPRISWDAFEALFDPQSRFTGQTQLQNFKEVEDPDDRKFAALAAASGAILITNDDHLLSVREHLDIPVLTPKEMVQQ